MAVILLNKKEWTKDGRKWIFYTRYKNLSGKTKQYKSKKFLNKKEAIEAERIFFLQLDKYRPDNDMTFKDLYTAFYEYQQDKVKETTLNTYKDRMRYMALLDNIKCKEFNLQHYEAWRKKILEYKLANRTRNYIYKFLKTIMNFGTKWYGINLMRFYKKIEFFKDPNEMKEEKDVYTFEEFQKYITGASNLNDKTMFEMLYYCGLRRGECRGLQWSDIDWNNKLVSITKQANSVKDSQKYYELTPPKTQKSIRTLPLTDVLYNDLVNLYNEKKKSLFDVLGDGKIRPNQLFSLSVTYPVIDPNSDTGKTIFETVKEKLLTKYGLKSLAKGEKNYIAIYEGDPFKRDSSYHQGITWVWLLGVYADSFKNKIKFEKNEKEKAKLQEEYEKFREGTIKTFKKAVYEDAAIGTISELYNSQAPFNPGGTISQAWSVSEILRIIL